MDGLSQVARCSRDVYWMGREFSKTGNRGRAKYRKLTGKSKKFNGQQKEAKLVDMGPDIGGGMGLDHQLLAPL